MEPKESALFIGASRGIGRTLALETARRGVRAVSVAREFRHDDKELMDAGPCLVADVASHAGMDYLKRERVWHLPYCFWIAGAYTRSRMQDVSDEDIDQALTTYQGAMVKMVRDIHQTHLAMRDSGMKGLKPEHCRYALTVIGSISSYKLRRHEAVYAMAKAGQAAFLRTFAAEMAEDLPGSRILLVNCARLGTEPGEQKLDAGGRRIDPGYVARLIWDVLEGHPTIANRPFTQINIERNSDGPVLSYGPQLPEIP